MDPWPPPVGQKARRTPMGVGRAVAFFLRVAL